MVKYVAHSRHTQAPRLTMSSLKEVNADGNDISGNKLWDNDLDIFYNKTLPTNKSEYNHCASFHTR